MEIAEQTKKINLTPAAAQAVQDLLQKKDLEGYSLRVFISGGGCSGYQCGLGLDNNVHETDLVFQEHGVQVIVDETSIIYLSDATIDYVEEAGGGGFKISNPNAIPACACGQTSEASEKGCAGCH